MDGGVDALRDCLKSVEDPEIPGMSIVDLGMVRDVRLEADGPVVVITPTYSGCPALEVIQEAIIDTLEEAGYENTSVALQHTPPWSSKWITPQGRQVLKSAGIAPPEGDPELYQIGDLSEPKPVPCPRCDSIATERTSEYGATSCKSLWFCRGCHEPFEYFKSF